MFFIGGKGGGGGGGGGGKGEGDASVTWGSEYFSTFLLTLSAISANDKKYLNCLEVLSTINGWKLIDNFYKWF